MTIFNLNFFIITLIKILSSNSYSEVKLTIQGNICLISFGKNEPSQIIVNNKKSNYADDIYCLYFIDGLNNITIIWNYIITDCTYMFSFIPYLISIDFSNFDTSEVTTMNGMFAELSLEYLDLSNFNTSKVVDMSYMFNGCIYLISLNLNSFDTSKVTNMEYMFYECFSLESLNLYNFNTFNVTKKDIMFDDLAYGDLILCFNETKTSNLEEILSNFENNCDLICKDKIYFYCLEDICPTNYSKLIDGKKLCISDCNLDEIYKIESNNTCYREIELNSIEYIYPEYTYSSDTNKEYSNNNTVDTNTEYSNNNTVDTNKEYSNNNIVDTDNLPNTDNRVNEYKVNNLFDIILTIIMKQFY